MAEQQNFDEIKIELTEPGPPHFISNIHHKIKLDKVRRFIDQRTDGWQQAIFTIPGSSITLAFYHQHKLVGTLFVGRDFFARLEENILLRNARKKELAELGELLDIKLLNILNDR